MRRKQIILITSSGAKSRGKMDIKKIPLNICKKKKKIMNHRLQEISEFLSENPKSYGFHIMYTSAVTFHIYTYVCREVFVCSRQCKRRCPSSCFCFK